MAPHYAPKSTLAKPYALGLSNKGHRDTVGSICFIRVVDMFRILSYLLACVITTQTAHAACDGTSLFDLLTPDQTAELQAKADLVPYGDALVWTATRRDTVLTIVGTMHLYDPRHAALAERIKPLLAGADLLMLEATKVEERLIEKEILTNPDLLLIKGPSLIDRLPPEEWAALAAASQDRDIPPFMAARMAPWFLALTLAIPECANADIIAGRFGLDQMLETIAEDAGVPTTALESFDTVFNLLAQDTIEEQLAFLSLSLMAPDLGEQQMIALIDSYFQGQMALGWELGRLASTLIPELDPETAERIFADMEKDLLFERNTNWIPVIEQAATQYDTIMIAAGAAHLPFDTGILSLLEAQGWDIAKQWP
jgi:uncharacterized protein YbaP (TraB family)